MLPTLILYKNAKNLNHVAVKIPVKVFAKVFAKVLVKI